MVPRAHASALQSIKQPLGMTYGCPVIALYLVRVCDGWIKASGGSQARTAFRIVYALNFENGDM